MEKEKQIERLEQSIQNLTDKKFKIYYFVPDMQNNPSGGIGVIYNHVKTLVDLGFNASILHQDASYIRPSWMGLEYRKLPHVDAKALNVSFEDIIVIPEGFTPVMQECFKQGIPARMVVFAQSWAYILNALQPGMDWSSFGVKDVLTVQAPLTDYVKAVFGVDKFNIKQISPSISDVVFSPSDKPKKPIIAISSREQFNAEHIIKQFYLKFPQYRWIAFKDMRGSDREDFADVLKSACLSVWVDPIAGFGTFPIESAKCGTPFIGLIPTLAPEYINEDNGIWVDSIFSIPDMIASYLNLWLEDKVTEEISSSITGLASMYTSEQEKEQLNEVFQGYADEKLLMATQALEKMKGKENE